MKVDHLSHTREHTFELCGQQFVYKYIEKLARPDGIGLIRGKGPHKSVEADLKSKLESGTLLEREAVGQVATDYIDGRFKGEVLIDGEFSGMGPREAKAIVREDVRELAFLHHDELAPNLRPTALEVRIEAEFPELPCPYIGRIDIIDEDVDVHDTKTKRKAPEKDLAHTSEQLTTYWGLFCAHKKRPPRRLAFDVLWRTPKGTVGQRALLTTRDDDAWRIKIARSLRMIEAIEKEIFLPAPVDHWACSPRWCSYTDVCPYFRGRPRATS